MEQASVAYTNWEPCTAEYIRRQFDPANGWYPGFNGGTFSKCCETPANPVTGDPIWYVNQSVCGDGLIQGSEECDCINNDCSLTDPCCNGSNCTLKADAICSVQDGCCDPTTCSIRNNTFVCRPSTSSCDYPETCDGLSSKCPYDIFASTGYPCITTRYQQQGTCYFKECKSAAEECIIRGLEQTGTHQWVDTCSYIDSGFYIYPQTSACSIYCETTDGLCEGYTLPQYYEDGTQCQDGSGCYTGICTPFNLIPVPNNPNCSNFKFDPGETDIDCGGVCFGCSPGKFCQHDIDCIFPGTCNQTTLYHANGLSSLGICESVVIGTPIHDLVYEILSWMQTNPQIWAPILVVIALLLIAIVYYCLILRSRRRNQNPKQFDDNFSSFKRGSKGINHPSALAPHRGMKYERDRYSRAGESTHSVVASPGSDWGTARELPVMQRMKSSYRQPNE